MDHIYLIEIECVRRTGKYVFQDCAYYWFCPLCVKIFNDNSVEDEYVNDNMFIYNNQHCPHINSNEDIIFICASLHKHENIQLPKFDENTILMGASLEKRENVQLPKCCEKLEPEEFVKRFPSIIDTKEYKTLFEETTYNEKKDVDKDFIGELQYIQIYKTGLLEITAYGKDIMLNELSETCNEYFRNSCEWWIKHHTHTQNHDYADGTIYLVSKESPYFKDCDTAHDGCVLYYEGTCRQCKKTYFSSISGD